MSIRRQDGPNFKPEKAERGTAAAKRHIARVKALPCVICRRPGPSDAHHIICERFGQAKASDFEIIPLCKIHHQHGPESIHQNKRQWQEKHGADHEFLPLVNEWIGEQ